MFGHNQPGEGDVSRAYTQSDSTGGITVAIVLLLLSLAMLMMMMMTS